MSYRIKFLSPRIKTRPDNILTPGGIRGEVVYDLFKVLPMTPDTGEGFVVPDLPQRTIMDNNFNKHILVKSVIGTDLDRADIAKNTLGSIAAPVVNATTGEVEYTFKLPAKITGGRILNALVIAAMPLTKVLPATDLAAGAVIMFYVRILESGAVLTAASK
jgi:hypothetical protein